MKSSILGMFLVLLASSTASATEYRCECYDTGLECDGISQMILNLSKKTAKVVMGDEPESDPEDFLLRLNGKVNSNYKSMKYSMYVTGDDTFPRILIENSLVRNSKNGIVKIPEMNNGELAHTWEFDCEKSN